ncbi:hypothetical protein [Haloparvum sedimenti]|uniref:hypothetical protein n=1 Tax=Haloparvum sedimenti TaxID=1678448 RepID=UPI00071E7EE7|nr:hypothetical protein [Haloparvum sedimenti]
MVAGSRRLLGVGLLVVSLLVLTQPLALRSVSSATVPTLSDPASYLAVLPPAALAAGATLFVAGVAAVRGRTVNTVTALATPLVAAVAGLALLASAAEPDAAALASADALRALVTGVPAGFLLSGAAVGGAVAPVVLGSVTEDTYALLAGAVVLLAGIAASPAPAAAGIAGLLGGGLAVAALWAVDAEGWRP